MITSLIMKTLCSLILIVLTMPNLTRAADLKVKVVSIHDGDTLTAVGMADKARYKIRLLGVDAPEVDFDEKSQGEIALRARDQLRLLAPEGSEISIDDNFSQIDKHGRVLGRLLKNDVDINREMIRLGWGVIYFIYPFDKRIVSDYIKSAKEAHDDRRGIFSSEHQNTEMPYLFRLSVRHQVGSNLVADFELKKVLPAEHIDQVPAWRRVFFPDYDMAYSNGYK